MTDLQIRSDREDITAEAADWLLRLEENTAPQTHADFTAWLKRSPRHMDEFLMVETGYRAVQRLDPDSRIDLDALISEASADIVPLPQRSAELLQAATEAASTVADPNSRLSNKRTGLRKGWAIAATVTLIVAAAVSFEWHSRQPVTYATSIGEQRVFELADGSTLHLNTRSRAEIRFSNDARDVTLLQGEALFKVQREAGRPFRVSTGSALVQAVGTAFNVYRRSDDSTLVSVIEGRVNVSGQTDATERSANHAQRRTASATQPPAVTALAAGEEVSVLQDGEIVRRDAPDVAQSVSWRQRRLVFRASALDEVVTEFNRYNADLRLKVDDDAIAQRRITGTFDANDPQAFVKFLQEDAALALERGENEVIIRAGT